MGSKFQITVIGNITVLTSEVQWIPLKKTTLGQPKLVFITDWSLYLN